MQSCRKVSTVRTAHRACLRRSIPSHGVGGGGVGGGRLPLQNACNFSRIRAIRLAHFSYGSASGSNGRRGGGSSAGMQNFSSPPKVSQIVHGVFELTTELSPLACDRVRSCDARRHPARDSSERLERHAQRLDRRDISFAAALAPSDYSSEGIHRRCQPLANFRHGVKLARLLIEEWGPAETK
jgi:hypothetical protein